MNGFEKHGIEHLSASSVKDDGRAEATLIALYGKEVM